MEAWTEKLLADILPRICDAMEAIASNCKTTDEAKEVRCYFARELAKKEGVTNPQTLNAIGEAYAKLIVPDVPAEYQVRFLVQKYTTGNQWE